MLSTVGHAGAVLDLFTTEHPQWGVTAAARRLGIPKSRAHDLLASLTAIGLLEHVPYGCYRLGWRSVALASAQMRTSPLKLQAAPVMREVARTQPAEVSLFVWDRGSVLCVDRQAPPQPRRARVAAVGARFRPNGSAAAKVLLAHRPVPEIRALLTETDVCDGHGLPNAESVEEELHRIRTRGFAVGREPTSDGTPTVAAPVRDARDDVVAALRIARASSGSDARVAADVDVAVTAAARVSRALCAVQSTCAAERSDTRRA
jgi:DNA-binding IclR family transcriptional regulator